LSIAESEAEPAEDEDKDFAERVLSVLQSRLKEPAQPVEVKAGRRLKDVMLKRLEEAMATIKELLSWAKYSGEDKSTISGDYGIAIKNINGVIVNDKHLGQLTRLRD